MFTPATGIAINHLFCQLYDVGRIPRQINEDFVQNHVITRRENESITLKNTFKRIYPKYADSMDRRSIILEPSCFSHQDASNDTHDDPNLPI